MGQLIESSTVLQRNPAILFNDFDDGIMMMDIDTGLYFDIDAIGSRIWSLLEAPASLEALCAVLVEEYEVDAQECLADLQAFAGELVEKGIVQLA